LLRKEDLQKISELKLTGIVNEMTDTQFSNYVQSLNRLIDNLPLYIERLRVYLNAKAYDVLAGDLASIGVILRSLYVEDISKAFLKRVAVLAETEFNDIDHNILEASVESLILLVSSLSIEIQMAAYLNRGTARPIHHTGRHKKARILAVDDALMFLGTLKRLLADAPYNLHCESSGREALQFLETHHQPDIILLDIEMPGMNGYELASELKQRGSKAPIIFITANSAREYVDKAVEAGAAGMLMKPLHVNQLLAKLKEIA